MFQFDDLSFHCGIVTVVYVFWILVPYQILDLHVYSHVLWLYFHFLDDVPWNRKVFNLYEVQFIYFFFCCLHF